jgi:hypothetical protein
MAYKQTPGRQTMPKTGRGIPPVLMYGSPIKQEERPDLTMKGARTSQKTKENLATNAYADQGLTADSASGLFIANKYEKVYEQGKRGQKDRILDGSGKVIAEATEKNMGDGKPNEKLFKEYNRQKKYTESSRTKLANTLNVFSGNKENMTQADIQMQQGIGNMYKN